MKDETATWETSREEFIAQWGALGSNWGINRTMAQIHALLMTAPESMHTEEIMERLQVSRGNANTNLRELVGWGLVRGVVKKGERREYFEAEKDVWKMFITIARERKRRELDPALSVLKNCAEQTKEEPAGPGKDFHKQMKELQEFVEFGMKVSDTVSGMKHSSALQWAMRLLS
ncbi:DNA-binding transcriptional regulator GbsR (MarR family) [Prosthecobacter fusiformis]|uniref:HTH-type transcriptional regulator n=1 Tax=Prosthecobacter fusiformis TaxID=48464 RepID=A0A4R7RYE3_9BACT|nr:transcriptional regulator [Prosthecobacter fusiformis]TDU70950.1 DNA-binding transcriptional regulator GbsR (MarR family) [Prosthecobacter fusiformis]